MFTGMSADDLMGWNSDLDIWICVVCEKEFKRKPNAKRHVELIHCENDPVQCTICFKWTKNKVYLKDHIRHNHKN